jgi:hypothetical protein
MSARFYAPGIGAFTQLDTFAGGAQNPLSMNRFLYPHANPATLTDPTGHCAVFQDGYCVKSGSSGTNAIQKQHQKKVHNAEIRRRNNNNARTREYEVESRSTNRSSLTNGQLAKARYLNQVAAARNNVAYDRVAGSVTRGNALAMRSYAELADAESANSAGGGSSLLLGCRLGDTLCLIGKQIGGLRTAASAGIALAPGPGDAWQTATMTLGYDPVADVHFTKEDQQAFAGMMLTTGGLGTSAAYGRKLDETFEYPGVTVATTRHPQSAAHVSDALAAGRPSVLTIDRGGAAARRAQAMAGTPIRSGFDRDEYPPAMFLEGGDGASVRYVLPGDNRGAGSSIGWQCRELPDGSQVIVSVC